MIEREDFSSGCDVIGARLKSAQYELADLESVVEELPSIMELKYRHALESIVLENRRLAVQHQQLRRQLLRLPRGSEPVRRFSSPLRLVPMGSIPGVFMLFLGILLSVVLLMAVRGRQAAADRLLKPPSSTSSSLQLRPSEQKVSLILRAFGSSWIEVQDLQTREVLFIGELQAGEQRTIRMRQGLRIRSGRPDLLTVAIDGAAPTPFGDHLGQSWRTFKTAGA